MRKLILFLLLLIAPVTLSAWVFSKAYCRLTFPSSYHYEPNASWALRNQPKSWQPFFIPGGVYGIVYNEAQGIEKYQVSLTDLTTNETQLIIGFGERNNIQPKILTEGELIKAVRNVVINRKYMITLQAWDLNGDSFKDTAIIEIKLRK